jgi:dipicolinate synthase subunit B
VIKPTADELNGAVILELASPPYGFDFGGRDPKKLGINYEILPALPAKFFPHKAARAAFDAITRFIDKKTDLPTIVLCITGSSCSYLKLVPILADLVKKYNVIPVLSANANLPNRFTDIENFRREIAAMCNHAVITTITGAETLSANKKIAASVILPATGNTIAKLCHAVTDTCVTMAVKALLRNSKPCIVAISTNDALSGNAVNIGALLNRKNFYFIPFSQDDPQNKPFSMVCDFSKAGATIDAALKGKQLQPIIN